MFNFYELNLLNKLLHRIKYSDFDEYDMVEFSNSPIMNSVLNKVRSEFLPKVSSAPIQDFFKFDDSTGKAIQKKLTFLSDSSYEAISKFDEERIEKFALDVIGPIQSNHEETEKLKNYIIKLSNEKIVR